MGNIFSNNFHSRSFNPSNRPAIPYYNLPSSIADYHIAGISGIDSSKQGQPERSLVKKQPTLLQIDGTVLAKIIAIKIVGKCEEAGKSFTVGRLLGRGAVETTDEMVFEREEWQKVQKLIGSEGDEEVISITASYQEILMDNPPTEELEETTPETTLTITAIVQLEELTEEEEQERHRLELKVELAFYEAGTALRKLRDGRFYRSTHRTFEDYCSDRFGFSRRHPYRLIDAATVIDNLCPNGTQKSFKVSDKQILPNSERQVRDLVNLFPEQQREIWQQAITEAKGKIPSGRIVKGIVERLKEKPLVKASDFCTVGDAFILTRLEGAERKYNGCWAIARELRDFTIAVDVHDTTLAVKPDNLDPIDLPDARRQLPEMLKRIRRLRATGLLSRCVYAMLESLGRQTYLDDFEAQLLTFMEQRYGIEN